MNESNAPQFNQTEKPVRKPRIMITVSANRRVSVRVEELVIPTYLPAVPDKNPMFLEKRVYQGSSGKGLSPAVHGSDRRKAGGPKMEGDLD
jgi:hypothetical protein